MGNATEGHSVVKRGDYVQIKPHSGHPLRGQYGTVVSIGGMADIPSVVLLTSPSWAASSVMVSARFDEIDLVTPDSKGIE